MFAGSLANQLINELTTEGSLTIPHPGAMLPPDETLIEELLVATYGIDNGKIRVMKKSVMRDMLKRSPDKADSLCLTFYQNSFFAGCDLT
jgi:hypothetical protein